MIEQVENIFTRMRDILDDVRAGKIKLHDHYECSACHNCGFREVADPDGSNYRGVVRCNQCRYWEYAGERIRNAGYGNQNL